MHLILMIAGGILLAFILLPFLGPLLMIALPIGALVLFYFLVITLGGTGMAVAEIAAENKKQGSKNAAAAPVSTPAPSFKTRVRQDPEYRQGLQTIDELLRLQRLEHKIRGNWFAHILYERFQNCSLRGIFRVEDAPNREKLCLYLQKVVQSSSGDSEIRARAEALSEQILALYDGLVKRYGKGETL